MTKPVPQLLKGAGLGLRRAIIGPLLNLQEGDIDFMEVAPENWINIGGRYGKQFRQLAERYPISLHGLSLNLGGFTPIDIDLVKSVRAFMDEHNCPYYSEHLSYCADHGQLYDLMPIPFTEEAINQVVARIRQVQDILGRRIAIENVSYYAAPYQQITEIDFIKAVINEADCDLLLDVNNIYVNSINHGYSAEEFLRQLPGEKTSYIHVAGHYHEAEDLRVDTHGSPVENDVWKLLSLTYELFGDLPTLLERDFNFPAMPVLLDEVEHIRHLQEASRQKALAV